MVLILIRISSLEPAISAHGAMRLHLPMKAWAVAKVLLLRLENLRCNLVETAAGHAVGQAVEIAEGAVIAWVGRIEAPKILIFTILPHIVSTRDHSVVVVLELRLGLLHRNHISLMHALSSTLADLGLRLVRRAHRTARRLNRVLVPRRHILLLLLAHMLLSIAPCCPASCTLSPSHKHTRLVIPLLQILRQVLPPLLSLVVLLLLVLILRTARRYLLVREVIGILSHTVGSRSHVALHLLLVVILCTPVPRMWPATYSALDGLLDHLLEVSGARMRPSHINRLIFGPRMLHLGIS